MDDLPDIILGHIVKNLNHSSMSVLLPQYHMRLNTREVLSLLTEHNNLPIVLETLMDYVLILQYKEGKRIPELSRHDESVFLAKYGKSSSSGYVDGLVYWKSPYIRYTVGHGKISRLLDEFEYEDYFGTNAFVYYEMARQNIIVDGSKSQDKDYERGICLYEIEYGLPITYKNTMLDCLVSKELHIDFDRFEREVKLHYFISYLMAYYNREDLLEEYKDITNEKYAIRGYLESINLKALEKYPANKIKINAEFLTVDKFTMETYTYCSQHNVPISNYALMLPPGDVLKKIVMANTGKICHFIQRYVKEDDLRNLKFVRSLFPNMVEFFDSMVEYFLDQHKLSNPRVRSWFSREIRTITNYVYS